MKTPVPEESPGNLATPRSVHGPWQVAVSHERESPQAGEEAPSSRRGEGPQSSRPGADQHEG